MVGPPGIMNPLALSIKRKVTLIGISLWVQSRRIRTALVGYLKTCVQVGRRFQLGIHSRLQSCLSNGRHRTGLLMNSKVAWPTEHLCPVCRLSCIKQISESLALQWECSSSKYQMPVCSAQSLHSSLTHQRGAIFSVYERETCFIITYVATHCFCHSNFKDVATWNRVSRTMCPSLRAGR